MKEILNFTKSLIKHHSTEENPKAVLACLEEIHKKFAHDFFIISYNFNKRPILVLSNTKEKAVDLIIAGHIDVVPAKKDGFTLVQKKDKLLGRGIYDMKGPLAASLFSIRDYLKENGNKIKVAIFITADEETDGLSTKYLIEKIGYHSQFAILPDGGNEEEIIISQKGFLQTKLTFLGKSSHASRPWNGKNPIENGLKLYKNLLSQFTNPLNEHDWKTSITLTKVNAGNAVNQIPDSADFYFDIRYINSSDRKKILGIIEKNLSKKDKLEIIAENESLSVDPSHPSIGLLRQAIKKISQKEAVLTRECGTSDAVFFSQNNIPAVLFRPLGGGAHQQEEWIDQDSLIRFYNIIKIFLESLR